MSPDPDFASDAALATKASAGDERAFSALVRRYERPIFALCARYLGPADGADAAQEAFVRAFLGMERFDPTRPLLPWLLTIARRACVDQLRSRKAESASAAAEYAASLEPASTEPTVAARQELELLGRAFAALPEGPREALALFHFHDLSYKEIAEQLEIPMGTVMTWIHRGRDALRQAMSEPLPAVLSRSAP